MNSDLDSLKKAIERLNEEDKLHSEELIRLDQELKKTRLDIASIQQNVNKQSDQDFEFAESLTRTATVLERIDQNMRDYQKDIGELKADVHTLSGLADRVGQHRIELDNLKVEVDRLKANQSRNEGSVSSTKYLIALFFTIFGGAITFILTRLLGG